MGDIRELSDIADQEQPWCTAKETQRWYEEETSAWHTLEQNRLSEMMEQFDINIEKSKRPRSHSRRADQFNKPDLPHQELNKSQENLHKYLQKGRRSSAMDSTKTSMRSPSPGFTKQLSAPPDSHTIHYAMGLASMMRLPVHDDASDLDVGFVGVPFDLGSLNWPGARLAPRAIRNFSTLVRPFNKDTGAAPFESLMVGDLGDIYVNPYDIKQAAEDVKAGMARILQTDCKPIAIGGDHSITTPTLEALSEKYGKVAMVHIDAHNDVSEHSHGNEMAGSCIINTAVKKGCIDLSRTVQIGQRGMGTRRDYSWGAQNGVRVVPTQQIWNQSLVPIMGEVRELIGEDCPCFVSFDMDVLDPAYAPGVGAPEIAGLTTHQALDIIRGCRGLNIVAAEVVETCPPMDPTNCTCITAASLLYELLCVMPGVKYSDAGWVTGRKEMSDWHTKQGKRNSV